MIIFKNGLREVAVLTSDVSVSSYIHWVNLCLSDNIITYHRVNRYH